MNGFAKAACASCALAGVIGAAIADEAVQSGREVYERRCRGCHGGTAPADFPIGTSLAGIIGTQAGPRDSGVHSRAVIDSGIVWDRGSLRRSLSDPRWEIPGTFMPGAVGDPAELERLLDDLESLR